MFSIFDKQKNKKLIELITEEIRQAEKKFNEITIHEQIYKLVHNPDEKLKKEIGKAKLRKKALDGDSQVYLRSFLLQAASYLILEKGYVKKGEKFNDFFNPLMASVFELNEDDVKNNEIDIDVGSIYMNLLNIDSDQKIIFTVKEIAKDVTGEANSELINYVIMNSVTPFFFSILI